MQCLTYNKTYRLLEDGEADDGVGLCLPDHVPELLYAVVVGVLADDELPLTVVARHPAGVDVVPAGDRGGESDPGEVGRHVVEAVVVEVVGWVGGGQILMGGGVELSGHTELLAQGLPAGESLPDHLRPLLRPLLHGPDKLEQVLFAHQSVAGRNSLDQNLS